MVAMAKKSTSPWPKKLRALRELWGGPDAPMPQGEAAAKIKVTRRSWVSWESGERTPSETVCLLIDLLLSQAKEK